jgi:hypothetical protein
MESLARGFLSLIVGGVAALAAAGPAAAIDFGPPVTISPPGFEPGPPPAAAVNASGDLAVGWRGFFRGVFLAYHPRHGSFGSVQRLRGRSLADLEVTARGEAIALLTTGNESSLDTGAAVALRPAGRGKRFGRPVDITGGRTDVSGLDLDANSDGEAVAVWESAHRVWAAIRSASGSWSAPVGISAASTLGSPVSPRVSVLPSGAVLAVWARDGDVEAAVRAVDGSFGAPVTLAHPSGPGFATIQDLKGVGSRWGVLIENDEHLQLVERTEAGAFSAPQAIPGPSAEYANHALALAPDGAASVLKTVPLPAAAVCSQAEYTNGQSLATTSRPAGGAFGPDQLVTPALQPGAGPSAAVAGNRAIFVWDQPEQTELEGEGDYSDDTSCAFIDAQPFGADGVPGQDPGQSAPAAGTGADSTSAEYFFSWPALATDPGGAAAVAWIHTDERGRNQRVRVALVGGGDLGRNPFPDIVSPRVLNLRLSSRRVHPGQPMALRFRLSERARVVVTITRWWGKHIAGQFHTQRVLKLRVKRKSGPVTLRFPAPGVRGKHYSVHLEARDRGGNPSYGGPFDLKFRVR